MIAYIMSNKKFQTIIKELFIRCRKLNILLVFITQSYFLVPKEASLNSLHYLKENVQFVEKVSFEPFMDFRKTFLEDGNIKKAATFKSFFHLSYKNTFGFS